MAYIFIAIIVLIVIGAFKINLILGLVCLLGSIFYIGGGFGNQPQRTKQMVVPSTHKPLTAIKPHQEPYYERNLFGTKGTLKDAIAVAKENGKVSTSLLQRELNVSYGEAADFVDEMEKQGIVGAQDGSRPRNVLVR